MMHSKKIAFVAAAAICAAVALSGPAQEAEFEGRVEINVIEVPVRVVDPATGQPVTGLTAKDFRVFENKRKRKITHFAEIGRLSPAREPSSVSETSSRPVVMVYFLDLFLMRKGTRDEAIEALLDRHAKPLPGNVEVSIIVFDGKLRVLIDRSTDRREILGAIESIRSIRARGIEQETAFGDDLSEGPVTGERDLAFAERRQRSLEYVFELERRVARVGDAISATMARYTGADGRKVLVAMTPGQPRTRWAPSYAPVDFANSAAPYPTKDLWQAVAHEASDLGFTLYTIDSSGIPDNLLNEVDVDRATTGAIGNSTQGGGAYSFGSGSQSENINVWMERVRKETLISTAEDTGGKGLFSATAAAITDVVTSLDHYYSLAYTAKHSGDGKLYTIEVELPNHPTYRVEARRAYVDRPPEERAAQRVKSTMLFGGDANPLGVRVELGEARSKVRLGASGMKKVKLPITVKVPIGRLELVERGTVFWGRINFTVFGEDKAGNQSEPTSDTTEIEIPATEIQKARSVGYFSYDVTVTIEGGQQKVWVGIEDVVSGKISIMPQNLQL